jgi:thioredoxin reductase (NADPH)
MITPAEVEKIEFYAALSPELRRRIVTRAADLQVNEGELIVHDGDPPYFWTVLSGAVEAIKIVAGREQSMTYFEPGEYFGEVPLMLSTGATATIRAQMPSRLMRVDPVDFHAIVAESKEAAALLAQSLSRRVNFIRDAYASTSITQATIVGDRYELDCHDIRDFLSRNQIVFEWLDPNDKVEAAEIPPEIDAAGCPAVILPKTESRPEQVILNKPTIRELADALGLQTEPHKHRYDVVIVGGGPAGLAAAVYGGSEGLITMMIEREAPGGQAGTSSRIENYLGFPGGVSGGDLANRALQQTKRFGTEILVTRQATKIERAGDDYAIELDGGERLTTRAIVIATGVTWRQLQAEGADALIGRGIYYGAARTEAQAMRGKNIFLIGGGNSAGQAAMFFSNYAACVTLVVRGSSLAASMSAYLIEQINGKGNINVRTRTTVSRVAGTDHLQGITLHDADSGQDTDVPADGLFVFIGADAETGWLPAEIERDERGYLRTGRDITSWTLSRPAYSLETSLPGVFAVGDVRSGSVKRIAAGVGEGSRTISYVHEYLATLAAVPV